MSKKGLVIVGLAIFCLTAVLFMFSPSIAVTGANSPPFNLYAAVMDIQAKVNSILGIFTTIEQKLWSASDSVKNDTLAINQKLDNVAKIESASDTFYLTNTSIFLDVNKTKPFKLTLSIATEDLEGSETLYVRYKVGGLGELGFADSFTLTAAEDFKIWTFECVTDSFMMYSLDAGDGFIVFYDYVIEYSE